MQDKTRQHSFSLFVSGLFKISEDVVEREEAAGQQLTPPTLQQGYQLQIRSQVQLFLTDSSLKLHLFA